MNFEMNVHVDKNFYKVPESVCDYFSVKREKHKIILKSTELNIEEELKTDSSFDPDTKGYSYLYLFKQNYHDEISQKLGAYPKIRDVKAIIPEGARDEYLVNWYTDHLINMRLIDTADKVFLESFKNVFDKKLIPKKKEDFFSQFELASDGSVINTASYMIDHLEFDYPDFKFQ